MEPGGPPIQYARSGSTRLAYQVLGEGPALMFHYGWPSNLAMLWQHPEVARFLTRLASFSRLILFDPRSNGLSDRGIPSITIDQSMDDIEAILSATVTRQASHFALHFHTRIALMYAATHPKATTSVATWAGHPTSLRDEPDYPWGATPEEMDWVIKRMRQPDEDVLAPLFAMVAPSVSDPATRRWWIHHHLSAQSVRENTKAIRSIANIDIRPVLGSVLVPVLLMHRTGDRLANVAASRYMAERIPNARLVEVPGVDHLPMFETPELILGELERFLTGRRDEAATDRVLATVLFTDIVDSTKRAVELGDVAWRGLLDGHDAAARGQVDRFQGRLFKTTGDGILATFDGPARAIRAATGLRNELRDRGIDIRAGLHTGEVELRGDDVRGIAVHIASRVSSAANAGEVLVSRTVTDLVTGSGIGFADRGVHELKGVPGEWQLFAVEP